VLCFSLMLIACSDRQSEQARFNGVDVSNAGYAKDFDLIDHLGESRHLADYKGKLVLVFFGYTHCPDVCPTTLIDMAKVMKLLGPQREKVQVLFITLDPERDTKDVLAKFVPSFDATFVGLYGSSAQIDKVANDFKVFHERKNTAGAETYSIDHSAGTYVYDQSGKLRLYFKYGQKPHEIANDLKMLM
jgi:protein SCO1/2